MADASDANTVKSPILIETQLEARRAGRSIRVEPAPETAEQEVARLKRAVLETAADVGGDLDLEAESRAVFVPSPVDLLREGGCVRHIALYLTPRLVDEMDRDLLPMFVGDNGLLNHRLGAEEVQRILQFRLPASASLFPPRQLRQRSGADRQTEVVAEQSVATEHLGAAERARAVEARVAAESAGAASDIAEQGRAGVPPKAPVAPSLLDRWHSGWVKKAGAAADSEERTLAAARLQFSDRVVSRQAIRDIRGERPRGRPKSAAK